MKSMTNLSEPLDARVPAIDRDVPAHLESATFALG